MQDVAEQKRRDVESLQNLTDTLQKQQLHHERQPTYDPLAGFQLTPEPVAVSSEPGRVFLEGDPTDIESGSAVELTRPSISVPRQGPGCVGGVWYAV